MNGADSDWQDMLSGIPQSGSSGRIPSICPLHMYINSLPNTSHYSDTYMYLFADDTKVFKCILTEDFEPEGPGPYV